MIRKPRSSLLTTVCLVACTMGESDVGEEADGPVQAPSAAAAGIDSVRLMRDLGALAHDSMAGRGTGTPGAAMARALIVRELTAAGVEPAAGAWEHPFTWGEDGRPGVNVIGRIPGTGGPPAAGAPDPDARAGSATLIVLTAHYDHLGVREGELYNGTDDNASGVAAALEIARIVAEAPLASTLVLALFDAEEVGLQGARAFVAEPPVPLPEATLVVNLDMVARSDGVLWAAGAHHAPALRPILERVAADAPTTLRLGHDRPNAPEGDDWTSASDHGPFHEAGIPFVYFGVEDHPDYHRPTDDVGLVDPGAFVASVRTIHMALRALDAALPLDADDTPR